MESDDRKGTGSAGPLRLMPGQKLTQMDDDVVERCYALWSTAAAMNAAATERRYADEVGEGVPVPTRQTINAWAKTYGWHARRDDDFRRNHGMRLYEMQMQQLANFEASGHEVAKINAGVYDENPMVGALRLKAREILSREIERKTLPLVPDVPAAADQDWDGLSQDERESYMRSTLQARKGKT